MSSREAWQALRASVPGCCPRTPLSTPPLHQGGGRSARKAPPPLRQRAKRVQGEAARGRGKGKPAQVTGGGDGLGRGPLHDRKDEAPPHPRPSPYGSGTGRKKVRRSMRGAPTTGKGERTPAPHFGRKSYSQEASFADGRKNVQAPPPGQESGEGKVLSGLGPSLPGDPAGPPPPRRRRPGQVLPLPQPGAHSPAARPRALSPRALRRDPSSSFSHSPSRAAPPLPPDPASGHSSHTPLQDPHSVSLTHSATTAPGRPTYYASLACYVPRARARPDLARGSLAGGGRRTPARAEEYGRAPEPPGR